METEPTSALVGPVGTRPTPIAPLPPEVVERIAAGEVIERPASVVRELIENALDAGARSIRLELREGGTRLIRVSDDGWGIPVDELVLACQSHASSKVHALPDLAAISTLGFRGEALASIAAIAELELASATTQDGVAETLSLRSGQAGERGRQPRPRGTTATVRELFRDVPARRALLRGPKAEEARCVGVVRSYALAHPTVRFVVIADGLLILQTPGTILVAAIEALYGADLARALIPLERRTLDGGRLSGYVGARLFHFPTREHVYLLLNGRPVANHRLAAGAEVGYRALLRKGRHPLLVVQIAVKPEQVDANVHPAKATVLLRDEETITTTLRDALAQALSTAPVSLPVGAGAALTTRFTRALALQLPAPRRRRGLHLAKGGPRYPSTSPDDDDPLPREPLDRLEPLAQFEETLILARSQAGHLFLVDQHRAHERVIYEQLLLQRAALERLGGESAGDDPENATHIAGQLLLEPLVVELTAGQALALTPRLAQLHALGLECQPFGGTVFLVRAVPQVAGAAQSPAAAADELVRVAAEDVSDWLDALCRSLACRTAVRRGTPLTPAEQQALLADLATVVAPALCPHGSPLLLRYTRGALARAFEW
jgi:DNA mismatch repair protein MutL